MDIYLATNNQGKVAEFKSMLMDLPLTFKTLKDVANYFSPEENGETFKDNALIKAKSLKAVLGDVYVIAEDSGISVDGLKGLPGVHSARYAGPKATDDENNAKILKMTAMRTPTNRAAHFTCVIALISPTGEQHFFEGRVDGEISKKLAGTEGFGYDKCFIPEGETKTFGELGLAFKNKVSHRAKAIRDLQQWLKEHL